MQIDRRQPENRLKREVTDDACRDLNETLRQVHAQEQAAQYPSMWFNAFIGILLAVEFAAFCAAVGMIAAAQFTPALALIATAGYLRFVRNDCEKDIETI